MTSNPVSHPPGLARRVSRAVGIGAVVLLGLLIFYATIVYVGWQSGQNERMRQAETRLQDDIARQVELAGQDIAARRFDLATSRLDWVLAQDPANAAALALQDANRSALAGAGANTPTPTATPRPTATPQPTPVGDLSSEIDDPGRRLVLLQRQIDAGEWERAIRGLVEFQLAYPDYERYVTDGMLFEAYIARGIELTDGDRIELGMAYFDEAQKLGPLPQSVLDRQVWAAMYRNAIAYYALDWPIAISYLEDLCFVAPFFHDACARLTEAYVLYGDQLAAVGEWCPAAEQYGDAQRYRSATELNDKLRTARDGCAQATPTPTPTPTPEVTESADSPLTPTPSP